MDIFFHLVIRVGLSPVAEYEIFSSVFSIHDTWILDSPCIVKTQSSSSLEENSESARRRLTTLTNGVVAPQFLSNIVAMYLPSGELLSLKTSRLHKSLQPKRSKAKNTHNTFILITHTFTIARSTFNLFLITRIITIRILTPWAAKIFS